MKKLLIVLFLVFFVYNLLPQKNKYRSQLKKVETVARSRGFNTNYCILIDFRQFSGERRMHLVNLKTFKIEKSFPVAQGRGDKSFSNVSGSNSSSLGMAVTREKGASMYGARFKYVLEGLDSTNSAIRVRNIVLHSWGGIPSFGVFPLPLYQSKGCPTISNKALLTIDRLIKKQINKKLIIYTFK